MYSVLYMYGLVFGVFLQSFIFFPIMYLMSHLTLTPAEKAKRNNMRIEKPVQYKQNKRKWQLIYFSGVPLYMGLYTIAAVVTNMLFTSAVFGFFGALILCIVIAIVVAEKEKRA